MATSGSSSSSRTSWCCPYRAWYRLYFITNAAMTTERTSTPAMLHTMIITSESLPNHSHLMKINKNKHYMQEMIPIITTRKHRYFIKLYIFVHISDHFISMLKKKFQTGYGRQFWMSKNHFSYVSCDFRSIHNVLCCPMPTFSHFVCLKISVIFLVISDKYASTCISHALLFLIFLKWEQ